ncbi:MAG: hypothetical protein HC773_26190 [Scytonema sp. CRU_2_7]|nr:hypothetical protein [Scytonema sp. CRU_2_7]
MSDRDFQNADQQTTAKIFEVLSHATGRDINETSLTVEDINNFPCKDLRTIDRMWANHSNHKFGLSVQKIFGLNWVVQENLM